MDIYADTGGKPLAAWQIELECDPAKAKIVGVESGGQEAPLLRSRGADGAGRIILANFLDGADPAVRPRAWWRASTCRRRARPTIRRK